MKISDNTIIIDLEENPVFDIGFSIKAIISLSVGLFFLNIEHFFVINNFILVISAILSFILLTYGFHKLPKLSITEKSRNEVIAALKNNQFKLFDNDIKHVTKENIKYKVILLSKNKYITLKETKEGE